LDYYIYANGIKPTIKGIREGKDEVLEKGIQILSKQK
jgi:hypothetical protein